ncbi:hypothetical protein HA402_007308 [Bradysia odoriphaga]|nr:hypothetical protein HA402_007308 [Bradysia odoriphaga]
MPTKINDFEVSALANAVGAISHSQVPIEPVSNNNNVQLEQSKDPWLRYVWRTVDLETERKRSYGTQSRAIQNKLPLKNAERMRRKQIRFDMARRQDEIIELVEMMENMRISNFEKSTEKEYRIVQLAEKQAKCTLADRKEKLQLEEQKQQLKQRQQQKLQQQQLQQQRKIQEQQRHVQEQQRQVLQQPQALQQRQVRQQQVQQSRSDTDGPNQIASLTVSHGFASDDRLRHYQSTMQFYERYAESVNPLQNDSQMKKFRFDLSKCVNILANSISLRHLRDRYDRFARLLSGNSIEIGGTRVNPQDHPLGIRYVNLLVAKMFVKQADSSLALLKANPHTIASLISALWQKFPDFGTLFLANLYKNSPLIVPYHVQRRPNQSNEDYLKSLGYTFTDNECEGKVNFLKRLTGLVRLYASVIISKTRRSAHKSHPHGIENAWIWLSNELNLDPINDVSATMLYEFIVITGSQLWTTNKDKFVQLVQSIRNEYLPKFNETDSGGPKNRLENLVAKILSENKINPPDEVLADNFW